MLVMPVIMKITFALLLFVLEIVLDWGTALAAEKPAKLQPVRIAVVSRGTLDLPFWVALERGFFRDEGIDAEIILFKASLTVQGMLGGSIDSGTATGTAVSAAVSGADVRIVMAMSERPSFDLMAHASIANVQQLRGKKIGYGGSAACRKSSFGKFSRSIRSPPIR